MLKLDEGEMQKLKNLAYDEEAIVALKKLFLNECLTHRTAKVEPEMLAASRLALDYVILVFDSLERMKENRKEPDVRKNIV